MIKKRIAYVLLIIGFISCNYIKEKTFNLGLFKSKTKVGIGLIHFNLNEPIPLFKSETDTLPYDTIHFSIQKQGFNKGVCVFKTKKLGSKLKPYIMNEGDSEIDGKNHLKGGLIRFSPEIVFRVLEKMEKGVVVMVNEETHESSFIKIDSQNDYRTNTDSDPTFFEPNFVDSKITNWYYYETWEQAIKRAYSISINDVTKVYASPHGKDINIDHSYFFNVDSIQNEWARLTDNRFSYGTKKIYGWIKWKENDSMQIGITLNGGYE